MGSARARSRFAKNRAALLGFVIVLLLVLFATVGPLIAPHGAFESDFTRGMTRANTPSGPSSAFWLGADTLYRDVFARLARGARLSLLIGFAATMIASVIGATVGILAGYFEASEGVRVPWTLAFAPVACVLAIIFGHASWGLVALGLAVFASGPAHLAKIEALRAGPRINLDSALMRVVDVGLAFPFLLLIMAIGAALDRTTATTILLTLGLTGWLGTARIIRAKTIQVRSLDFITAARALGQSTPKILAHHVLPNVAGPLIVIATISVAQMIVAESVLSFLGAGISPPTPTWGHMLYEGQAFYASAPWLLIAPGAAILLAVLGFNLLGEGLRDALDPKED